MYDDHKLDWIHLELSELCNLKCPLCARNSYGTTKSQYNKSLSIKQIKKYFPLSTIEKLGLKYILFCGSYGDPVMAKDIFAITEYFLSAEIEVSVATHGSLRSASWWNEYGGLGNKNEVIFAIDGLEDTNNLYRKGASWGKLTNNVNAFIAGGGNAVWQFIPFEHNEYQVGSARKLAKEMGFKKFVIRKSNRLMWKDKMTALGYKDSSLLKLNIKDKLTKLEVVNDWIAQGQEPLIPNCKALCSKQHPLLIRDDLLGKSIKVSAEGIVYPCGWLQPKTWYSDYGFEKDEFCLDHHSLFEVLDNDFFKSGLQEKWRQGAIRVCVGFCSYDAVIEQEVFHL